MTYYPLKVGKNKMEKLLITLLLAAVLLIAAAEHIGAQTTHTAALPDKTYAVKGIRFTMKGITAVTGAVLGDTGRSDNQEHTVDLSAYYIGETEVTQELWQAVMGHNPSHYDGSQNREPAKGEAQGKRPVENVTWFDCIVFCNELTKKLNGGTDTDCVYTIDGIPYTREDANAEKTPVQDIGKKGFRLPTEAEWEWAAMGGTDTENDLDNDAWYADNSNKKTHQVKLKSANGYGLYDMIGNVWEWCWNWYDGNTPDWGQINPKGAASGSDRVNRGGSWYDVAYYTARAYRFHDLPNERSRYLGLRLICSIGSN